MGNGEFVGLVLALFFGGIALAAWGYDMSAAHPLITVELYVVGYAFVTAAIVISFLRIFGKKTEQPPADQLTRLSTISVLVKQIGFEYLPASPLENGWKVAYSYAWVNEGGQPAITEYLKSRQWRTASDSPTKGSISMNIDACAIDYELDRNATFSDRLECEVKFGNATDMFVRVEMASGNGSRTTKLIKFVLGTESPSATKNWENDEWTLPIYPQALPNGWRKVNISLADAVAKTWGRFGWTFRAISTVRLRGELSISPIRLYAQALEIEEPPTIKSAVA
jgi:hypothetical protein